MARDRSPLDGPQISRSDGFVPEPFGIVRMSAYTAKLNGIDPQAWVADVLARIADHNIHSLDQLLPWNWKAPPARLAA